MATGDLPAIPQECLTAGGVGLIYEMEEYNAPRACTTCAVDSDYYVFMRGVISAFICAEHFREAPVKPADEIEKT